MHHRLSLLTISRGKKGSTSDELQLAILTRGTRPNKRVVFFVWFCPSAFEIARFICLERVNRIGWAWSLDRIAEAYVKPQATFPVYPTSSSMGVYISGVPPHSATDLCNIAPSSQWAWWMKRKEWVPFSYRRGMSAKWGASSCPGFEG